MKSVTFHWATLFSRWQMQWFWLLSNVSIVSIVLYNVPILLIILSNYNVPLCPFGVPFKITICPFEHIFIKFGMEKFSQEIVKPFQFWLKLNKHNGCFAGRTICLSVCIASAHRISHCPSWHTAGSWFLSYCIEKMLALSFWHSAVLKCEYESFVMTLHTV